MFDRLQRRADADGSVGRTVGSPGPLFCGIFYPEIHRVHTDLRGHQVHGALYRERCHGRRRRPIGGHFGPIGQHVVGDGFHVGNVVAGPCGHGPEHAPDPGKGAVLVAQGGQRGRDGAIFSGTDLYVYRRRAGRSAGTEHLFPAHHDLDRTIGLARQGQRHRLHPDMGLAAEAATNFR